MQVKLLIIIAILLFTNPAYAYIGPGMGAGAIATTFGILGSIILVIIGILYYPIKRILKKRMQSKQEK